MVRLRVRNRPAASCASSYGATSLSFAARYQLRSLSPDHAARRPERASDLPHSSSNPSANAILTSPGGMPGNWEQSATSMPQSRRQSRAQGCPEVPPTTSSPLSQLLFQRCQGRLALVEIQMRRSIHSLLQLPQQRMNLAVVQTRERRRPRSLRRHCPAERMKGEPRIRPAVKGNTRDPPVPVRAAQASRFCRQSGATSRRFGPQAERPLHRRELDSPRGREQSGGMTRFPQSTRRRERRHRRLHRGRDLE